MMRWFRKRYDQRLSTAQAPSMFRRARRLVIEHCEDRCMLSGTPFAMDLSAFVSQQEGGFLTVNAGGLLQSDASDFLLYDNTLSESSRLVSGSFLGSFDVADADSTAFTPLAPNTPLVRGITNDVNLDLRYEPDTPSANDNLQLYTDAPTGEPLDVSPGLPGKSAKLLVIDKPIQIALDTEIPSTHKSREGGTLEVASAITTTQREYATRLSAVVVSNLNREGTLPTIARPQSRPLTAELARLVAFETIGRQQLTHPDASEQATEDRLFEPLQVPPTNLEPNTIQIPETAVSLRELSSTEDANLSDVSEEVTSSIAAKPIEPTSSAPTERIDKEHAATLATTFASWPLLATVVASYLLVERRQQPTASAVQMPPRRRRAQPDSNQ